MPSENALSLEWQMPEKTYAEIVAEATRVGAIETEGPFYCGTWTPEVCTFGRCSIARVKRGISYWIIDNKGNPVLTTELDPMASVDAQKTVRACRHHASLSGDPSQHLAVLQDENELLLGLAHELKKEPMQFKWLFDADRLLNVMDDRKDAGFTARLTAAAAKPAFKGRVRVYG